MAVVVDVGCHGHPEHQGRSHDSIRYLVDRFRPALLYGFDPHPDTAVGELRLGRTLIRTYRQAAGTRDGTVAYTARGLSSFVGGGADEVPCFDLAAWLEANTPAGCVLKLDVQGAEYALLEHLLATGADRLVLRLLVEWHKEPRWKRRRAKILRAWRSPVETWD